MPDIMPELIVSTPRTLLTRHEEQQKPSSSSSSMSLIRTNIFSTPAISSIWSDTQRTAYYLLFEASLASVQADIGIIPRQAADAILDFCHVTNIDFEELRIQTEKIGYPVLGVVKQIVQKVNCLEPGLGEWAHWGATTQDVTDTATILQLRDTLNLVSDALNTITSDLHRLCQTHKTTLMVARSNLQQAVPMTFGFKMARLLATFERHKQRLAEIKPRLLVLEFGGAAGTLATIKDGRGLECQAALAQKLGLAVPEIAWHTERDRIAEVGGFFALLTGTCSKFAMDVKLMMQTEVGEVSEPFYPHPRFFFNNAPEAATVRQLSTALYDAMVEDHERSTGPWEIEWIVLPQICTLTHAALLKTSELIAGLEVHSDVMKNNLEITRGGVVSEAVMMGLAPKLGRQFAHDLVYELCRRSVQEDVPLLTLLYADDKVRESGLSKEELEGLCDPSNYTGLSVEMVDRVLAGTE
ncbi:L-Aspartase-like protein [Suillus paluster]|uniref:L-Aspartase-like protein n=1 Tax=Suillus paluster TaxID=48578 RepID=UPI001B886646|nr:L-Aspartase-like protein [Suillus paluster]KAG1743696.1 L-Aspartase-like protein [Suillus paluster]